MPVEVDFYNSKLAFLNSKLAPLNSKLDTVKKELLVEVSVKSRMIGFWLSFVNGNDTKLSKLLYTKLLYEYNTSICKHKCVDCIKDTLVSVGRVAFSTGKLVITQRDKLTISRVLFDLTISNHRLPIETGRWKMCRLMKESINYVLKIN